jgi:flagellar biosynthesis protein FlhF
MRVLKFEGATMRDAVAKVKAELGNQAVIISSRQVRRGLLGTAVEISAAIDDGSDERSVDTSGPAFTRAQTQSPLHDDNGDMEKMIAPLRSELRSLRAMVRSNTQAPPVQDTKKLETEIAALRQLVEKLRTPESYEQPARSQAAPQRPQQQASAESIAEAVAGLANKRGRHETEGEVPLIAPSTARVVMLVGPTGAGKTTTIAKLAAHAALVEGRRVRLITLDTYRVGGVDQIRTFADLIGVPLTVLDRPADLADAIDDEDELTLIDTAGRSPRDTASIVELAAAVGVLPEIEIHLAIPAASSATAIDELVARYTALQPSRLLFTKVDEHDAVPELLKAPRRTRLPITWVTTGQQVPEDLEQPTATRLGELAAHGIAGPHRTNRHRAA